MRQLELFFAMGCRLSDGYLPYKWFLLEQARAGACAGWRFALVAALGWLLGCSQQPRTCLLGYGQLALCGSCAPLSISTQAAQQYSETGVPSLDAAALSQPQEAGDGATLYRCRKCRGLVATQHNIVDTEQVGGRGGGAQFVCSFCFSSCQAGRHAACCTRC